MKKEKHNGIIGLWKFIFCLVIAIYHGKTLYPNNVLPIFRGGYIAVEFFFIISGFYFAKTILKEKYSKETIGKDTISYIWKRIKRLLPYLIIVYVMFMIGYQFYEPGFTISQNANSIWSLLLLKGMGFRGPYISSVTWFLTVLFVSMLILYPIVKKYKENFILPWSIIIAIFFLGYLNHGWLGLDQYHKIWSNYMYTGMIRGFAEINLGMVICIINEKLKNVDYTKIGKLILTVISEISLIAILLIISLIKRHVEYDYVMLLMIFISIIIMVSEKTYDYKLLSNKFIFFLEKISIPIFINHQFFFQAVKNISYFRKFTPVCNTVIFVTATIVFSILEYLIINKISQKSFHKIKDLFIVPKKKAL